MLFSVTGQVRHLRCRSWILSPRTQVIQFVTYAAWTSTLNNKEVVVSEALKGMQGVAGKELWVAGRISHPARTAIESRGWVVHDRAREKLIK
jgi:hypothetical protein